jgi:hypothetical protein
VGSIAKNVIHNHSGALEDEALADVTASLHNPLIE